MSGIPMAVTIPTKNSGRTLEACLRSVNSQDSSLEIVVADDCSTDGTREIAGQFGARIVKGPLPLLEARYRAAVEATSAFVVLLDSDQILRPGVLHRCVDALDRHDALILHECSNKPTTWIARLYAADRRYLHATSAHHMDAAKGSLLPRVFRRSDLLKAFESIPEEVRKEAVAQDHAIIYHEIAHLVTSVGIIGDAVEHQEMETYRELWRKYVHWGEGLVRLFKVAPGYETLSRKKVKGRFHASGAPVGDYLQSLLLLGLKAVPYAVGYTKGRVALALQSRRH
jgi:glycosyltransferase involved in cell wall biosynthesis